MQLDLFLPAVEAAAAQMRELRADAADREATLRHELSQAKEEVQRLATLVSRHEKHVTDLQVIAYREPTIFTRPPNPGRRTRW